MTEALFILCAAVAAVCALVATVAARKCSEQSKQAIQLCTALSSERGRLAAHDAELDTITATLRKLSGRIGAITRAENRETENGNSEVPPMLRPVGDTAAYKAQLRAKLGLVPGKPAPRN